MRQFGKILLHSVFILLVDYVLVSIILQTPLDSPRNAAYLLLVLMVALYVTCTASAYVVATGARCVVEEPPPQPEVMKPLPKSKSKPKQEYREPPSTNAKAHPPPLLGRSEHVPRHSYRYSIPVRSFLDDFVLIYNPRVWSEVPSKFKDWYDSRPNTPRKKKSPKKVSGKQQKSELKTIEEVGEDALSKVHEPEDLHKGKSATPSAKVDKYGYSDEYSVSSSTCVGGMSASGSSVTNEMGGECNVSGSAANVTVPSSTEERDAAMLWLLQQHADRF